MANKMYKAQRGIATKLLKEVLDIITHEDFTRLAHIKSLIKQGIGILTETADLEQE